MSLTKLPLQLVRVPFSIAGKARDLVGSRFGGADIHTDATPSSADAAFEPAKFETPKPKAAAKKTAAKKTAAKKPKGTSPTAPSAASSPTPTSTASAAERAGVIAEQTDGLDDATDRAEFELHKRDVDVNGHNA